MFFDESDNDINVIPYHDLTRHVVGSRAETHLEFPDASAAAVRSAAQTPATWAAFINAQPLPADVKAWHLSPANPLKEHIRQGFAATPV